MCFKTCWSESTTIAEQKDLKIIIASAGDIHGRWATSSHCRRRATATAGNIGWGGSHDFVEREARALIELENEVGIDAEPPATQQRQLQPTSVGHGVRSQQRVRRMDGFKRVHRNSEVRRTERLG